MIRKKDFDEADIVIVKEGEHLMLAIYDVSETVYYRWIAVTNEAAELLYTFGSTREMIRFVAKKQIDGWTVRGFGNLLDHEAQNEGCENWGEYVEEVREQNHP